VSRLREFTSGWRGVSLVAITYVYFLIFAQFAFLNRLAQLGIADAHLKTVMAAMAFGGMLFSLLSTVTPFVDAPRLCLQFALFTCGSAAVFTLVQLDPLASVALSFVIGAGLGLLTVTLVSNLRLWLGTGDGLLKVGLGTGLGYFLCNLPPLFTAAPGVQAITAATLVFAGILIAAGSSPESSSDSLPIAGESISYGRVVLCLTALVWLDSAAFFIIQHTQALKAGTWEGSLHLWINGLVHLAAALVGARLLYRRGLSFVLGAALLALACACLLLRDSGHILPASFLYPIGVSLYSVALVAYPSLLSAPAPVQQRARRAGLIYAIAGWFGSAMGIGMGQHLGRVPIVFVLLASALIFGPWMLMGLRMLKGLRHRREIGTVAAGLTFAFCISWGLHAPYASKGAIAASAPATAIQRGRKVYIAEGCIHCHSQYVRPNTPDVLMWGPTEALEELRLQHPPLIGNRRQGPDLSQVGGRRSSLWFKAHFSNPQQVSHASFMPSYAYLFERSVRGDDLIQYLSSLKSQDYARHIDLEQAWQPSAAEASAADSGEGAALFSTYCATCHEGNGATRLRWRTGFKRLPPDLRTGPWIHVQTAASSRERSLQLARIVKFGIPGTDMPGHEYLSDRSICSISLWLNRSMVSPGQFASTQNSLGENR